MVAPYRLLLAVDFSKASIAALRQTRDLAERTRAHVTLVHAFSPAVRAPVTIASISEDALVPFLKAEQEMHLEEAQALTERWAQPLRESGIDVDVAAVAGSATDAILEVAEATDVDLIILGRQGMGMVRRFFTGSVTRFIVEKSRRPVMVVPSLD